jgi:hypothetical protein
MSMFTFKKTVVALGLVSLFSATCVSAFAQETQWQKQHPRRDDVNSRLDKQDHRIKHDVKDGQMSKDEAHNLHQQDHKIRQEERTDAKFDNGHITKSEKKTINQQENDVSHEINHNG